MDVVLYTVAHPCPLCDEALAHLEAIAVRVPFRLRTVVVDSDPRLVFRHALRVPVLEIDGLEAMHGRIDRDALERALRAAALRPGSPPKVGPAIPPEGPPSRLDSRPEDPR